MVDKLHGFIGSLQATMHYEWNVNQRNTEWHKENTIVQTWSYGDIWYT